MLTLVNALRIIHKPGYLAHEWLARAEDDENLEIVISTLSGIFCVVCVFLSLWPLKSIWNFFYAVFLSGVLTGLCIFVSKIILVLIAWFLGLLLTPTAMIYCWSIKYINRKRMGQKTSVGTGPKAEVGLRYFIEKEKNVSPYKAKYIDPS